MLFFCIPVAAADHLRALLVSLRQALLQWRICQVAFVAHGHSSLNLRHWDSLVSIRLRTLWAAVFFAPTISLTR